MEELLCHLLCGGLPGVGDLPGLGAGAGLAESGPRELHRELEQMLVGNREYVPTCPVVTNKDPVPWQH